MHAATLRQPLKTTLRVSPLYYDRGQQVVHSGLSYWVEGRGSIIFNRGRSVASWTFTGRVFVTRRLKLRYFSLRQIVGYEQKCDYTDLRGRFELSHKTNRKYLIFHTM